MMTTIEQNKTAMMWIKEAMHNLDISVITDHLMPIDEPYKLFRKVTQDAWKQFTLSVYRIAVCTLL